MATSMYNQQAIASNVIEPIRRISSVMSRMCLARARQCMLPCGEGIIPIRKKSANQVIQPATMSARQIRKIGGFRHELDPCGQHFV